MFHAQAESPDTRHASTMMSDRTSAAPPSQSDASDQRDLFKNLTSSSEAKEQIHCQNASLGVLVDKTTGPIPHRVPKAYHRPSVEDASESEPEMTVTGMPRDQSQQPGITLDDLRRANIKLKPGDDAKPATEGSPNGWAQTTRGRKAFRSGRSSPAHSPWSTRASGGISDQISVSRSARSHFACSDSSAADWQDLSEAISTAAIVGLQDLPFSTPGLPYVLAADRNRPRDRDTRGMANDSDGGPSRRSSPRTRTRDPMQTGGNSGKKARIAGHRKRSSSPHEVSKSVQTILDARPACAVCQRQQPSVCSHEHEQFERAIEDSQHRALQSPAWQQAT